MDQETPSAMVRIGELGRRVGVSEHVLRAWERRYGLLRPERSPGGYRLYSAADERRVRRMQAHLAAGLSAAEAARAALSEERPGPPPRRVPGQPTAAVWPTPPGTWPRAWTGWTSPGPRRRSTGCSPASPPRPSCGTRCCRTCMTSGTAGKAGRSASPVSTSPATCCAGGWPASPGDGDTATGRGPSSPAPPVSSTTWAC